MVQRWRRFGNQQVWEVLGLAYLPLRSSVDENATLLFVEIERLTVNLCRVTLRLCVETIAIPRVHTSGRDDPKSRLAIRDHTGNVLGLFLGCIEANLNT